MNWELFFEALTGIGAIATGGAFAVAIYQLLEVRKQLSDTRNWNRMNAALQHMPRPHEMDEYERELNKSFLKLIDRTTPLSQEELEQLFSEPESDTRVRLKNFLNLLELYCSAINHGIIDSEVAKTIYGFKFERHFLELKPYIERSRNDMNKKSLWIQLEKVIQSWEPSEREPRRYADS